VLVSGAIILHVESPRPHFSKGCPDQLVTLLVPTVRY